MLLVLFACATVSQKVDGFQTMLPKIVGGLYSNISDYSYAAELSIICIHNGRQQYWSCGSSVLNQYVVLTAGHCMSDCDFRSYMTASVGSNDKWGPNVYSVYSYLKHNFYEEETLWNDIAVASLTTPLQFDQTVGRIVLVPNPPYNERAYLAGWGLVSEEPKQQGQLLKSVQQQVYHNSECKKMHVSVPAGTFCASSATAQEYPSMGDSGSALVVRRIIQIGLVSFKSSKIGSRHVVFYTDVGYYYDWIKSVRGMIVFEAQLVGASASMSLLAGEASSGL